MHTGDISVMNWKNIFGITGVLLLFAVECLGQVSEQTIKSFGAANDSGSHPKAPLIQGADGGLYGTTDYGGSNYCGTVFRINADGTGYTVLCSFGIQGRFPGQNPHSSLVQTSDGMLYGASCYGGSYGAGMIYKLQTNGSGFTTIFNFSPDGPSGNNANPNILILGNDGRLYGTTTNPPVNGLRCVFAINTDGTGFSVLATLTNIQKDPNGLIQGSDGILYGTTKDAVFKLQTNDVTYSILHAFKYGSNGTPWCGVIQGADSRLYGTTYNGGTNGVGSIFSINTDGTDYTQIFHFTTNSPNGRNPCTPLLQGPNGNLYGATLNTSGGSLFSSGTGYGTVFQISTNGSGYNLLHTFGTNSTDGKFPSGGLVRKLDGAICGTTFSGGASNAGTLFKLNPDSGNYTVVFNFNPQDAQYAPEPLIQDSDGTLYGASGYGGNSGFGTLFRLNADGTGYNIIYNSQDSPHAPILGSDGYLYNTTTFGGDYEYGTIFKVKTNGTSFASLYSFGIPGPNGTATTDGTFPSTGLVQAGDGNLYGVAQFGAYGKGVVYMIKTNGSGYIILHRYDTDGANPLAPLIQGKDGAMYGSTSSGGGLGCTSCGSGTVFRMITNSSVYSAYQTLHTFYTNSTDGQSPSAALIQGTDGLLYGTTPLGGSNKVGTVFKLSTNGTIYSTLYHFKTNGIDGQVPRSSLIQGPDGALYGTTSKGGSSNAGTFFRLSTNGLNYSVLHNFGTYPGDGALPYALMQGLDKVLYGGTISGGNFNNGGIFTINLRPLITTQPQSTTTLLNNNAIFTVSATSVPPVTYQWLFNGTNLTSATNNTLVVNQVIRTNAGNYGVLATNAFGGVFSTNATLSVLVPQFLSPPTLLSNGMFQLVSSYMDGWPIYPADFPNFEIQTSSNLVNWATAENPLSLSNGFLIFMDSNIYSRPSLFYRSVQHF